MPATEPDPARNPSSNLAVPGDTVPTVSPLEPSPVSAVSEAAASAPAGLRRRPLVRSDRLTALATPVAFLLLLVVGYGFWLGTVFLNTDSRVFDVYQNVPALLVAVGVVICLAAGQFDLSAGAMATLSIYLTIGLTVNQGWPLWVAIVVALLAGILAGLLNAFLVVQLGVNAFIATLGTGGVIDGIYTLYSNGQTISLSTDPARAAATSWFSGLNSFGSFQLKAPLAVGWLVIAVLILSAAIAARQHFSPDRARRSVDATVGGAAVVTLILAQLSGLPAEMNWTLVVLVGAATAAWVMLRFTTTGRHLHATGANPVAARLAGVRVQRMTLLAFVMSGLFAALAGVILGADQGTATPGIADVDLLPAYAAAFLSTVILSNGRFHVWGAIAGGAAVVYIAQGLVVGGVNFTWTDVVNGTVLIIAVALSTTLRRRISRA